MTPAQIAEAARRVAHWMSELRTAQGVVLCPEHRIEHTGKNAGLVVMACEFAQQGIGDRDAWFELAQEQALRLASRLEREGDSTCFTFRPGRHDPYNCSNNVIDGGACSDALGTFLETFGGRLEPLVRELLERACVLHAQTYLRYAAFDKGIAAQRAWALTGVAQAWRQAHHGVLEYATIEGAQTLFASMHADGSFAYHGCASGSAPECRADELSGPDAEESPAQEYPPAHPGATDVSAFYQSRVTGFVLFALDRVGQDLQQERWREPIRAQLDFLAALFGPHGRKVGSIEAKPWYHGAEYEVASHPFDVFALARGARLYGQRHWGLVAWRAACAWAEHVTPAGQPQSHLPGPGRKPSYQCPTFWAGHSSWLVRALPDLEWIHERGWHRAAPSDDSNPPAVSWFEQAQLVRLENEHVVAWVRGARPGANASHGSPQGAGLLQAIAKPGGQLALHHPVGHAPLAGEWMGVGRTFPRPLAGWRHARGELRFSFWLARNAWRRFGLLAALREPVQALRRGWWRASLPWVHSAWHLSPRMERLPSGVSLASHLAYCDGAVLPGSELERRFELTDFGLQVTETRPGRPTRRLRWEPVETDGPWVWNQSPATHPRT